MRGFPARRAIERLRAGLFDPVAADRLTMEETSVIQSFSEGLKSLEKGQSGHLCICGSYGQGKSHSLTYLSQQALCQGYATSSVQLDIREVPFYRFPAVYQSLMQNLSLPTGDSFVARWKEYFSKQEEIVNILDEMPPRFRMILQTMISQDKVSFKRKKVRNPLKSKDFDNWIEKALKGQNLPMAHLKHILQARGVKGYKEESLICFGNLPYVQMIQSLGKLLHVMGFRGLVLFFDEAESILQGRPSHRIKSYEILNWFFQHSGFVYPVLAFTETFFDRVRSEDDHSDASKFPQNYCEIWQNLRIVRLQSPSSALWEGLQDRLIDLYAEAYQIDLSAQISEIKRQMNSLLEKLNMQETRFKLKALIHQLDIICIRTAS